MFLPAQHVEVTIPTLRKLMRDNPLGVLTTAIPSQTYPLIQSSHIPFVLDVQDENSETELGVLRGHLAKQNPQSKAMMDSLQSVTTSNVLEQEVLVLFTSPIQHYVTPKFYTETKPDTGKVVPTWNYAAVQAYGRARIYCESKSNDTTAFLSKQIDDLSHHAEESIMGYTGNNGSKSAWKVTDAPERYVQLLQKNIIGIEITLDRLEGKFKMSQEKSHGDREGLIQGFKALETQLGSQMAEIIQERGHLKDIKAH